MIIKNYLNSNDFKFSFFNNYLNVVNYLEINFLEENKISLSYKNGRILIKGKNLKIKKLLDKEILVYGNIECIEIKE